MVVEVGEDVGWISPGDFAPFTRARSPCSERRGARCRRRGARRGADSRRVRPVAPHQRAAAGPATGRGRCRAAAAAGAIAGVAGVCGCSGRRLRRHRDAGRNGCHGCSGVVVATPARAVRALLPSRSSCPSPDPAAGCRRRPAPAALSVPPGDDDGVPGSSRPVGVVGVTGRGRRRAVWTAWSRVSPLGPALQWWCSGPCRLRRHGMSSNCSVCRSRSAATAINACVRS